MTCDSEENQNLFQLALGSCMMAPIGLNAKNVHFGKRTNFPSSLIAIHGINLSSVTFTKISENSNQDIFYCSVSCVNVCVQKKRECKEKRSNVGSVMH